MKFQILTAITKVETIASRRGVEIRRYLERVYGKGRWRKMKDKAIVQLEDGIIRGAEIHWYEALGIGRKDFKVKRFYNE